MKALIFSARGMLAVTAACLMTGCASLTWEAEDWRVGTPDGGQAHAVVRYIGLGTATRDPASRAKMVEYIHTLAADETPSSAYAPLLRPPMRRVYLEGDKIVLEESGDVRDPFTWFEQTGLNPVSWFTGSLELSQKDNIVVKRGIGENQKILATDGRMLDEDTYVTILKGRFPIEISGDTKWQRREDKPNEEDVRTEQLSVIVWPRVAQRFYWRLSGRAFGKRWQSLAEDYAKAYPETPRRVPQPEMTEPAPIVTYVPPVEPVVTNVPVIAWPPVATNVPAATNVIEAPVDDPSTIK